MIKNQMYLKSSFYQKGGNVSKCHWKLAIAGLSWPEFSSIHLFQSFKIWNHNNFSKWKGKFKKKNPNFKIQPLHLNSTFCLLIMPYFWILSTHLALNLSKSKEHVSQSSQMLTLLFQPLCSRRPGLPSKQCNHRSSLEVLFFLHKYTMHYPEPGLGRTHQRLG